MPWLWPLRLMTPFLASGKIDQRGGGEAEHRGEQHGEGQDRAAVDDQQDEEDDAERDAEQDAVDAAEGGDEVGEEAAGPGDVDRQPGRRQRRRFADARRAAAPSNSTEVSPHGPRRPCRRRAPRARAAALPSSLGIAAAGGARGTAPSALPPAPRSVRPGHAGDEGLHWPGRSAGVRPPGALDDDEVGQRLVLGLNARDELRTPSWTRPTWAGRRVVVLLRPRTGDPTVGPPTPPMASQATTTTSDVDDAAHPGAAVGLLPLGALPARA